MGIGRFLGLIGNISWVDEVASTMSTLADKAFEMLKQGVSPEEVRKAIGSDSKRARASKLEPGTGFEPVYKRSAAARLTARPPRPSQF